MLQGVGALCPHPSPTKEAHDISDSDDHDTAYVLCLAFCSPVFRLSSFVRRSNLSALSRRDIQADISACLGHHSTECRSRIESEVAKEEMAKPSLQAATVRVEVRGTV